MPVANQLPYKRWVFSISGCAAGPQSMPAEKVSLVSGRQCCHNMLAISSCCCRPFFNIPLLPHEVTLPSCFLPPSSDVRSAYHDSLLPT